MRSTMMDVPLTIASIMRYGTSIFGDREVVTWTGAGTRRRSYAEAGRRAAQLANALRRLGVDADQRVGTFMWNNAEHLEAYLAVPSMGAVLHTLNVRLAADDVAYIATHAEDHTVIVDASLVPAFAKILPQAPTIRNVIVSGGPLAETPGADELTGVNVYAYEELIAAEADSHPWPVLDERSAAAMCYTSGTTGHPKGIVYSHRSSYLHSMGACLGNSFAISERDRVLPVVPMFHANAWGLAYAALLSGADLIMPDRHLQPATLVRLIEGERVTVAGGVPTIWAGVLAYMQAEGGDLSSLRLVVAGGSAVPHALQDRYSAELGVRILQAWGMTETSPLASVANPPPGVSEEEAWSYRDSQGRLFCAVEGRLAGDSGDILPNDGAAVGEVEVRGPWITGSYYKDDDAAKFHDGWLKTGDVGTLDEHGFIRLTDRAKDVIKSGGEWISSMELENILMAHPDVAEAAVIGVADEKWGERPLAAVVLRPGAEVSAEKLRDFMTERIPRWQLPERWCFIDEVPKTSVGKFSKRQMREAYQRGDYKIVEVH
ncbi:MAG TPA: long-chain fatty acid--CoA ligase [Streptosporangiaceae bacterium]|nr:long-chain fatty acid--CoA ligase [Streptosporangiaceae bacterium]